MENYGALEKLAERGWQLPQEPCWEAISFMHPDEIVAASERGYFETSSWWHSPSDSGPKDTNLYPAGEDDSRLEGWKTGSSPDSNYRAFFPPVHWDGWEKLRQMATLLLEVGW